MCWQSSTLLTSLKIMSINSPFKPHPLTDNMWIKMFPSTLTWEHSLSPHDPLQCLWCHRDAGRVPSCGVLPQAVPWGAWPCQAQGSWRHSGMPVPVRTAPRHLWGRMVRSGSEERCYGGNNGWASIIYITNPHLKYPSSSRSILL